jgi:hypothetical protein
MFGVEGSSGWVKSHGRLASFRLSGAQELSGKLERRGS